MSVDGRFEARRPGAALAAFFSARGYRVVDAVGVLWCEYRPHFYMSLPYEARMDLEPRAVADALRANRLLAVRHATLTQPGLPCGLFVRDTRSYSLACVEPRYRRYVQKGLSRCEIRPATPDDLLAHGLELNLETMQRHGRFDPECGDPRRWRQLVAIIAASPQVVVTGAFLDGRLSAYMLSCRDGAWLHLLIKASRTAEMVHRTNAALDFAILEAASRDQTIDGVTNSWTSITGRGSEGLHAYKRFLGYRVLEHDLGIHLHPALAPALTTRAAVVASKLLSRHRPADRRLELVERLIAGARATRTGVRLAPEPRSESPSSAHA